MASGAGLGRTIPALPVRDVPASVSYYRERFGFAGVLHRTARELVDTDFGSREFHTVDGDGNLLTFFRWL